MGSAKKKSRWACILYCLGGVVLVVLLIGGLYIFLPAQLSPNTTVIYRTPTPAVDSAIAQQLARIDEILRQTVSASISYNAPKAMQLDKTVTIELLLDLTKQPSELGEQITEPGQVVTAVIEVTPRMKAELFSQEDGDFIIQPLHGSAEQFISSTQPTVWQWDVTPKKGGTHRLTLIIYRLISIDGKEEWREVETYRSDIEVNVTIVQRIKMLDWKWLAGILITALLIPAFWRIVDGRRKRHKKH